MRILPDLLTRGSLHTKPGKNTVIDGKLGFNYNKKFGVHTIMAAFGVTGQATESNSTTLQVSGMPNDYLNQLGMANGYGTITKPASTNNVTRSLSSYYAASVIICWVAILRRSQRNASGSSQLGSHNRLAPVLGRWGLSLECGQERNFSKKNAFIQQFESKCNDRHYRCNQNFAAPYGRNLIFQYNLLNNYRLQRLRQPAAGVC